MKIRSIECFYFDKPEDDQKCDDNKPEDEASCNLQPCPAYKYSNWSSCSVSCGIGQKTRTATCNLGSNKCDSIEKNQTTVTCTMTKCSSKCKFFMNTSGLRTSTHSPLKFRNFEKLVNLNITIILFN